MQGRLSGVIRRRFPGRIFQDGLDYIVRQHCIHLLEPAKTGPIEVVIHDQLAHSMELRLDGCDLASMCGVNFLGRGDEDFLRAG